ncbi:MAG: sugar-binding protein, partial [Candidatus Brocadiia bacterium]
PLYSETYTFTTRSDDGVRLWVNGQSVIDNWTDHGPTYDSGTIALSAGTKYDIQLDYYENGGGAVCQLSWSSASQAEEIIPQSQLYSSGGGDTTPPAAPTNLSASAGDGQVDLNWDDNTEGDLDGYSVYRSTTSGSGYGSIATVYGGSAYSDTGVTNGTTYYYVVTAFDTSANESGYSNEASATPQAAGLPSPWQNQDIGSPSAAGSAGYSSGTFTIEGDGNDIWNNSDNFHYVYQSLSGDGEIEARVASLENTNSWAKAGVMIRESLTGGSTHAMMVVTPGNGTSFQRRTSTGSTSESTTPGDGVTAPYWVRVTRSGDTFTGYKSSDGSSWTQVGSVTISMATDVYIGLPVTSHSDGVLCTAEMDNVTVTSGGGDTTPPAAPTGLTATAASDSQIDLDWDDNTESDLDSYNVYRDGSQIATGVTVSSYSDAGLSAETQYCYTVTAVDTSSNESAQSAQDCATTQAATTADATISEAASAPTIDGSADAVWADTNTYSIANALSGATGGTDLSGQWRALWDSTNLYYLVEVTDDAQVNDSTDAWDDDSVEIYIDADNSKGTSYDGVNDYQLVLRWNDATIHLGTNSATDTTGMDFAIADTADGYTVEVLVPWSTLGVTPAAGNLIGTDVHVNDDDDGGARDGKISWFAMVDNSWSDPSTFAEAELVAGEADTTPPANPTGLSATAGDGQVDLNWDDNTEGDLASYSVYRSTTSGSGYSSIATGVASSAYTDTGVTNGTTYYYVVTAVDTSSNESGYSNEASATPEAGPAFAVKVNFQPSGSTVPDGYVADVSQTYGDRGNGYTYGWEASFDETRDRDAHSDQRYDTLNHLQLDGTSHYWEIAVPDGTHDVWLVCGDPSYTDQVNDMVVEGTSCNDPDGQDNFDEYSVTVNVTDGRLTIEAAGSASNSKVCFVEITQQ